MRFLVVVFLFISFVHVWFAYHPVEAISAQSFPFEQLLVQKDNFEPAWLHPFVKFDSLHYLLIAEHGYGQYQQAYFPLFPLLLALFAPIFQGNFIPVGMLVGVLSFFVALIYFKKYAGLFLSQNETRWALLFLIAFPSAFFFQVMYPTSLLFFLSVAALYYLATKQYLKASFFAALTSFTGVQGVLLLLPFFLSTFEIQLFRRDFLMHAWKQFQKRIGFIPVALSPLYGLATYSFYLWIKYGDPLYFYHAQEAFGANRSSNHLIFLPQVFYRYLKIFFHSDITFQYMIAVLEFSLFSLVFGSLLFGIWKLFKEKKSQVDELGMQLYCLVAILLPTLTGTLTSMPRYLLVALGFFFILARIRFVAIKFILLAVFFVLQLILYVYFIRGYFIS